MIGSAGMQDAQRGRHSTVKKYGQLSPRYCTALFLTVVYLLIAISPLTPIVLRGESLAHASTGECAGNGTVCRCSPERRANHTCCCCQKQQKQEADSAAGVADCCKKMKSCKVTLTGRDCPCDSGKALDFLNLPKCESLPFVFDTGLKCRISFTELHNFPSRLLTRLGDPPDLPPHIAFTC